MAILVRKYYTAQGLRIDMNAATLLVQMADAAPVTKLMNEALGMTETLVTV